MTVIPVMQPILADQPDVWRALTDEQLRLAFETDEHGLLTCLLYTSPSPRDRTRSRMPSSA